MEPVRLLKDVFGYDSFRPGQERLVNAVLEGRDVMGIMPTGAGKSVCYQLSEKRRGPLHGQGEIRTSPRSQGRR